MPESGEVLMQGPLGSLLPMIESVDAQDDAGCWVAFGPAGVTSFSDTMFIAVIYTLDFEEDDWLPEFAIENHLEPVYDVYLMQDVIINAKYQKPDVTISEIIAGLNYFSDHDAFLDFGTQ